MVPNPQNVQAQMKERDRKELLHVATEVSKGLCASPENRRREHVLAATAVEIARKLIQLTESGR